MKDNNEPRRGEAAPPVRLGANDTKALTHIVSRHAEIAAQVKEMKFEQKELEDSAWEKCGKSPKAIRQLAKESSWDAVKRERQKQLEEEIDTGRAALGLLADTPLGEAEMERMERERSESERSFAPTKPNGEGGKRRRRAKRQQPEGVALD